MAGKAGSDHSAEGGSDDNTDANDQVGGVNMGSIMTVVVVAALEGVSDTDIDLQWKRQVSNDTDW